MVTVGILTEKPKAAKKFAAALGGMSGTYQGEDYVIVHARGHLYEFAAPHEMVAADLAEKYQKWDLAHLPWDHRAMDWSLVPGKDTAQLRGDIKRQLSGCSEIVVATDVDPTGEGGMIAVNAFLELGLSPQKWSRMLFTDEAAVSLQQAFTNRKPIPAIQQFDEYLKANYRAKFDLLSMQFTRIATHQARRFGKNLVPRQGRLKSAMVKLVGDQLKAHSDYVKKPFFENRFRDENGVMYTNPEEPRFDSQAEVPQQYQASPVALDKTETKRTAPPKLLDLASLAAMLVGKGVKAKLTLSTYQQMYEAEVVSYPRTEDKTITPEQHGEMMPLVDQIAGVVGVDPALLSHRTARSTHVKPQGAHGANRPGLKVPSSLDDVEQRFGKAGRLIYETLAKNFLAMLAEDYVYEQQKGHVANYPAFVGLANVPQSQGWKQVFDPDAGESDEDESTGAGLGSQAEPIVFEGANRQPEHPTMTWLMRQLEKRDVGTGATRTSTYSEITSTTAKYPLLIEQGRKVKLAESGEISWMLLPDTRIGDLQVTEQVYAQMRDIAAGKADADELLAQVADWVREDIVTMERNAETMRQSLGLQEQVVAKRAAGVWQAAPGGPREVAFKQVWGGHEFTEDEIAQLLAGEEISFTGMGKSGSPFPATGKLGIGVFNGQKYVGFQRDMPDGPTEWCKHVFTEDERAALERGDALAVTGFVSKEGKTFNATVKWDAQAKRIEIVNEPPKTWSGHEFTDAELKILTSGKPVTIKGLISSRTKKEYNAKVEWKAEKRGGRKKLVPTFIK